MDINNGGKQKCKNGQLTVKEIDWTQSGKSLLYKIEALWCCLSNQSVLGTI